MQPCSHAQTPNYEIESHTLCSYRYTIRQCDRMILSSISNVFNELNKIDI